MFSDTAVYDILIKSELFIKKRKIDNFKGYLCCWKKMLDENENCTACFNKEKLKVQ